MPTTELFTLVDTPTQDSIPCKDKKFDHLHNLFLCPKNSIRRFLILFVILISSVFVICRNEYLIFQKIIKLEYEFPEKFFPKAKDLVKQLLVSD